jgi:Spy/CpxP family protein refolding chaperone
MKRLKLIMGVTLVFLAGALAGSLGTGIYLRHKMEAFEGGRPGGPEMTSFLVKRFTHDLDLTQAQQAEVRKIVEESEQKIKAIRQQYLPEIKGIIDQSFALMREKLSPEQQKKLYKLHEKLERSRGPIPPERMPPGQK